MAKLTLAEAADKLGISVRTLRRRIKEGVIAPSLESGKYYIVANDLDSLAKMTGHFGKLKIPARSGPSRVIIVDKMEYDRLIARLGFLEGQHQLLVHQKPAEDLLRKDLNEARSRLAGLAEEVNRLKKRLDAIQGLIMRARPK
jgi:hypothetical protein